MKNTTNIQTQTTPQHTGRTAAVLHHLLARWPTVLGLLALLANTSNGTDSHVVGFIVIIASMCYVAAAAIGSRRSVWVMALVASIAVTAAGLIGLDPTVTLLVMGAGFTVFGFLRGSRSNRREVAIQAAAFVGFSAIALAAMMTNPTLAIFLAAAAAIGHAIWDAIHFIRDKVVSRSLTEACFILDLGLGIALLLIVGMMP